MILEGRFFEHERIINYRFFDFDEWMRIGIKGISRPQIENHIRQQIGSEDQVDQRIP
jgi:hypothetical protein